MAIQIKKAVRERVFLKIAVGGPTGSGKTWGAIGVAKGLAPTGKVLVLDTENRSASYYAGPTDTPGAWDFDVVEIEAPFTPTKYLEGLRAAIDNGYEAVVIDSLTHEWNASGGILDQKSQKDARGGNSFTNWNDMKQIHNKFVETLLQSKIHVVVTLRSKMEYVMEEGANKKVEVKKIGLAPISSDGMEYEFGVFFDVDRSNHLAVATKDRTSLFEGRSVLLGDEIGRELRAWRDSGAELSSEAPKPEPPPTSGKPIPTPAKTQQVAPRPTQASGPATPPSRSASQTQTRSTAPTQTSATPVTSSATPEPPAEWVAAMVELAEVTMGMPEKTRAALVASFEADGPTKLPELLAEIATIKSVLPPQTAGEVISQLPRPEAQQISQEAIDFVEGIDPTPADTDEANGGISQIQYEALGQLVGAFRIDRDALRSWAFKSGHLLPGANGPTLSRMKAEEFAKLRTKLTNNAIAAKGETWSQRTVRIINATPITTYQPMTAAS